MTLRFDADQTPRVSVIVPAYNAEDTIGQALASVFAQTWRDFEVIVVDDGSTDRTRDVVESWRARVRLVCQPNGGPGRARNAGVDRSRGDLVAFLDADDVWLPTKLARQVEYFDAFPATGLLHGEMFLGEPPAGRLDGPVPLSPPRRLFCEIFETEVEINTTTVMLPRRVLVEVGGFDERREVHVEDWDLWLRVSAKHPVGFLRCPLAVRRRPGGMSRALDKRFSGQKLVVEKTRSTYCAMCADRTRGSSGRVIDPLHRGAYELGQALLAREQFALARRAFRTALGYRPFDVPTHVYHLASYLPPRLARALRAMKRRVRPPAPTRRVPDTPRIGAAKDERRHLVHDTRYRRIRHRVAERLRDADHFVHSIPGRRRRILFEAASPLSFVIFKPIYQRLAADPRIEFRFSSTSRSWPAEGIFRAVGIAEGIVPPERASWMKFDACINTDFYEMTWLRRCSALLHLFHGVAGKYSIDAPLDVAPDIAAFDALLFPNRDRLERYLRAGLIDERVALLVGYPKVDCLVDGSLDRQAIASSLGLPPGQPTVLYAPTWSPDSSLHTMGETVVCHLLDAGFNVLVKLHDRSYDLTRRASGGIDWTARFSVYEHDERVRIVRDPDASRALIAADALITDHSSIGFEYALLDRPIVVIDAPDLLRRARINPEKVRLLRSGAEVVQHARELEAAIVAQLSSPTLHAVERKRIADEMFYRPGTATDRAVAVVYDAIGLDMPRTPEIGRSQRVDVLPEAARRAS